MNAHGAACRFDALTQGGKSARSRMLGISSLGVCAIILGMSSYMIIHATNQLKQSGYSSPSG